MTWQQLYVLVAVILSWGLNVWFTVKRDSKLTSSAAALAVLFRTALSVWLLIVLDSAGFWE